MTRTIPVHPEALVPKDTQHGTSDASPQAQAVEKTVATKQPEKIESGKWRVPVLPYNFNLDAAQEKAYQLAARYMNKVLEFDDMQIALEPKEAEIVGTVSDLHTGDVVNRYDGIDVLKLYAKNMKERGIIVDGRV